MPSVVTALALCRTRPRCPHGHRRSIGGRMMTPEGTVLLEVPKPMAVSRGTRAIRDGPQCRMTAASHPDHDRAYRSISGCYRGPFATRHLSHRGAAEPRRLAACSTSGRNGGRPSVRGRRGTPPATGPRQRVPPTLHPVGGGRRSPRFLPDRAPHPGDITVDQQGGQHVTVHAGHELAVVRWDDAAPIEVGQQGAVPHGHQPRRRRGVLVRAQCGGDVKATRRPPVRDSITRGYDPRSFDHENHRSLRGTGPMPHPFGDGKALPRGQLDRPTVQVNHEPPLYHVKELVFFIVLVPVKLSASSSSISSRMGMPSSPMRGIAGLIARATATASRWTATRTKPRFW